MPRIMELWAKFGLTPERGHGGRTAVGSGEIYIYNETPELDEARALEIAESMYCVLGSCKCSCPRSVLQRRHEPESR